MDGIAATQTAETPRGLKMRDVLWRFQCFLASHADLTALAVSLVAFDQLVDWKVLRLGIEAVNFVPRLIGPFSANHTLLHRLQGPAQDMLQLH